MGLVLRLILAAAVTFVARLIIGTTVWTYPTLRLGKERTEVGNHK